MRSYIPGNLYFRGFGFQEGSEKIHTSYLEVEKYAKQRKCGRTQKYRNAF